MVSGQGTFHSLRHSLNTHFVNAGVPVEVRVRLTGHSSKVMNARYTHLAVKTLKTAMANIPLFGLKKIAPTSD
ncbi:MAG: tyrosine-type recombinase/integrase [Verrucomicrobiota bacterium]